MKKLYLSLLICFATYNLSNAQCSAEFNASHNPICTGDEVYYTNLTTGIITAYSWDFGVGATPATFVGENPPNITYSSAGTKTVSLSVSCYSATPQNCVTVGAIGVPPFFTFAGVTTCTVGTATLSVSTRTGSITVLDVPVPAFTSAPASITCANTPVNFTYTGTAATSYSWDFGAGASPSTSTDKNPVGIVYGTSGSKTVSLTVSNGACQGSISQAITVNSPTASFTSTANACANTAVNFTNTGSTGGNWKYSWDFGAGATPGTSSAESPQGVVYSTSGSKTITFTVYDGSCSATTVQTITINPTPTSSFTSSAPACTGQNVDFTNTGTGTAWSWNFGASAAPATSSSQNPTGITYSTPGGKNVTLVSSIGTCSLTATQAIIIYQSPTATITAPASACTNAGVNFSSAGSSTGGNWRYSWDFGAGSTPTTSTATNPNGIVYSTAGLKTVALTVFDNHCSATFTTTITINQTPTAGFTSNTPACTGSPVDFFNTGTLVGVTWAWNFGSGAAPATSTTQDQLGVIYSTSGGKSVQLITKTATCADTLTQAITIYQSPTVTFDLPNSVCTKTKIDFTNTGSTGSNWVYTWDFGADAMPQGSTGENPVDVFYTSSGTKTITFTISDEHCSNTLTKTLIIKSTPKAGFSSTAPQCTDLPVDFINLGTTGGGLTWAWNFDLIAATAAPATATLENPTGIIYSTAGEKIVQQIVTNSGTTCSDTSAQAITIHQTPTATFTSNAPKCVGDSVRFTNTGSTGGSWTYFWDFGQDALPQTSTAENPSGVAFSTGGAKTITFTVFNGYCTKTATQSIIINALPIANAGRDTTICANTTVQIGSANISGNTYSWFAPVTLSSATVPTPVATPIAHITQYIVTVKNTNTTCINKDSINVTMLDPIKAYAGVDVEICRYDSVQIGVGLVEQQIYSWSPIAGLSNPVLPNPVASPDSTTIYTVTVTYKGKACKAETDEVTITVHQLPIIEAGTIHHQPSPNDTTIVLDTITVGSSIQLVAIGGVQYSWSPAYHLSNVGIYNPIATPDTSTTYVVTGIDIYGCINRDTVTIKVIIPSFWVPTAFSPNGNGENDVFYVRGAGIQNFELGIFNRWGEQIYYSKKIEQGWDGTRPIGGEELPAGAYVYYIKGKLTNGDPVDAKGLINLIR